ncbi:MAG: nuclear transport factor 2 family protein [Pseudomonadota bacterium]
MKSLQVALLASITFLASSSVVAQVVAEADEPAAIWQSLRETDNKLAERSRIQGFNQAFLNAFGEGAVVFRRGPVEAEGTYQAVDPARGSATLESRANYIEFSRAGDLGLTTGPYRYTMESDGELRRVHGHFVTIWRKFDNEWRMLADITVRVPGVLSLDVEANLRESERALAESAPESLTANNTLESLVAAEELFVRAINFRGGRRAMLRYGLDNQRIYVPGMVPGIGSEAGGVVYGAFMDKQVAMSELTHQPGGAYMAESGDVGYTYGTMSADGSSFNYLRFWRFTESGLTESGEWKIAVEILNPF